MQKFTMMVSAMHIYKNRAKPQTIFLFIKKLLLDFTKSSN